MNKVGRYGTNHFSNLNQLSSNDRLDNSRMGMQVFQRYSTDSFSVADIDFKNNIHIQEGTIIVKLGEKFRSNASSRQDLNENQEHRNCRIVELGFFQRILGIIIDKTQEGVARDLGTLLPVYTRGFGPVFVRTDAPCALGKLAMVFSAPFKVTAEGKLQMTVIRSGEDPRLVLQTPHPMPEINYTHDPQVLLQNYHYANTFFMDSLRANSATLMPLIGVLGAAFMSSIDRVGNGSVDQLETKSEEKNVEIIKQIRTNVARELVNQYQSMFKLTFPMNGIRIDHANGTYSITAFTEAEQKSNQSIRDQNPLISDEIEMLLENQSTPTKLFGCYQMFCLSRVLGKCFTHSANGSNMMIDFRK